MENELISQLKKATDELNKSAVEFVNGNKDAKHDMVKHLKKVVDAYLSIKNLDL